MERNLYCTVVEVPVLVPDSQVKRSARDLLPWADPYIAGLIRRLQDEVRQERAARRNSRAALLSGMAAKGKESAMSRDPRRSTDRQLARPPGTLAGELASSGGGLSPPRNELSPPGSDGRLDFDTPDYETWPQCDDVPGNRRW